MIGRRDVDCGCALEIDVPLSLWQERNVQYVGGWRLEGSSSDVVT